MLEKAVLVAKTAFYASLAGVAVYTAMLVNDARSAVKATYYIPGIVQGELQQTRGMLDRQMNDLRTQTLAKITQVQTGLSGDLHDFVGTADGRLSAIQTDTFNTVNTLATNVNSQLTTTNQSVTKLTSAYADLPKTVGARFDYFTNCDANGLCWQNQASDALLAFRKSSRDTSLAMGSISETIPVMAKDWTKVSNSLSVSIPKITDNVAGITQNIEQLTHPKWYWRLLGGVAQGSSVYFNVAGGMASHAIIQQQPAK